MRALGEWIGLILLIVLMAAPWLIGMALIVSWTIRGAMGQ